jgi:hypothetical protein
MRVKLDTMRDLPYRDLLSDHPILRDGFRRRIGDRRRTYTHSLRHARITPLVTLGPACTCCSSRRATLGRAASCWAGSSSTCSSARPASPTSSAPQRRPGPAAEYALKAKRVTLTLSPSRRRAPSARANVLVAGPEHHSIVIKGTFVVRPGNGEAVNAVARSRRSTNRGRTPSTGRVSLPRWLPSRATYAATGSNGRKSLLRAPGNRQHLRGLGRRRMGCRRA